MINIELIDFRQVNIEFMDIDFYEIQLEDEELEIEISFKPLAIDENSMEVFLHIRYFLEDDSSEDKISILHSDFLGEIKNEPNKKLIKKIGKEQFISINVFSSILSSFVSMARGYLICQTKGTPLGEYILPIMDIDAMIDNSPYKKNKNILLEK